MATNVSSVVSHFPDAENGFTTTTAGSVSSGAVTVTLNGIGGYTNGQPVVLVIDPTDAAKKQTFTGIVDTAGVQVTSVVWTAGTNQTHALGATVVDYATATHIAMISKGIQVEHAQTGTHTAALVTSRTEDTSPDVGADFLLTYDTSATALKKVKPSNLGLGDSWIKGQLPAVSSVTNNGNGSVDITFASTVANILTPGMRLRTTRTVAAPTGAISLNGTSQSATKATPGSYAFTNNFTCSAWVRLSSYPGTLGVVISKRDAGSNNGFIFEVLSTGQVLIDGRTAGVAKNYTSYQSLPLNKWVHIAATFDMTTAAVIYINGIVAPSLLAGTATSITQAGNLEIGVFNGTGWFPGNIIQASTHNAVLTQAQIRAIMAQTISSSSPSIIDGYLLDQASGLSTVTATGNNLTANGSPTYTASTAPWTTDANGVSAGTYDWEIVTKVATTVATVQVPEGCAIPTSGGITTVDYSGVKAPFGMPVDENRWSLLTLNRILNTQSSAVISTWYNIGSFYLTVPVGVFKITALITGVNNQTATGGINIYNTLSTSASSESDRSFTATNNINASSASQITYTSLVSGTVTTTAQTVYYGNIRTTNGTTVTLYLDGANAGCVITAIPVYL